MPESARILHSRAASNEKGPDNGAKDCKLKATATQATPRASTTHTTTAAAASADMVDGPSGVERRELCPCHQDAT